MKGEGERMPYTHNCTNTVISSAETMISSSAITRSNLGSAIEEYLAENGEKQMNESKETKSKMLADDHDMLVVEKYMNGQKTGEYKIIPDVVDIREFNDDHGDPCAIYLDFADGTTTCAARRDSDVFNFEHGVTICIAKRLLDKMTDNLGSSTYNKIVRRVCKLHDSIIKEHKETLKELEEYEKKYAKIEEKKRRRAERREAKMLEEAEQMREELIEMQKEAFVRALKECGINGNDLK